MTPEELEKLPKPLERIMSSLELDIMLEIIERIKKAKEITPVTDWLLYRLNMIGESKSKIKKQIRETLKKSQIDIDQIYEQAARSDHVRNIEIYKSTGRDYIPYEDNKWLQQVVDAAKRQTEDSLRPMENLTKTTGFNVKENGKTVFTPMSDYLERSLDKAMLGITTGMKTYSQAIAEVVDEMTASGVRVVSYPSGKTDRIEVAARRAVMTGIAQMTDKVNEKNAEILGTDHWEVDWHMGARNTGTGYLNHQSWQGKVYTTEEMKTVCGLGEMLGFAGINCYHIRFPFIPGVSKRKYTDEWLEEQNRKENEKKIYRGREYDTYAALQHQRALERTIRKRKQDVELLMAAEDVDKEELTEAKCRLRAVDQEYVRFSKEMGLRQQRERLKVGKINSSIKNDTIKAIKIPQEVVGNSGVPADIMKEIQDGVNEISKEYDVKIDRFIAENVSNRLPDAPYLVRFVDNNGMKEVEFVINTGYDFSDFKQIVSNGYAYGYFAGRSVKDHAIHEMAHAMTGQQYKTISAFDDFAERIEKMYVPGVSGYADEAKDGFEVIAEAFVRMRNNEQVPIEAEKLVLKYIERWKR